MSVAIYVSDSGNKKIMGSHKVDATYVSIKASCPTDCPLMGEGCYAQTSYVGITNARLDQKSEHISPVQAAQAEVKAIDSAYQGGDVPAHRDLRLHVAGDSRTITGTRLINKAIARWKKRGGGDCWSYTHAWKKVPRHEWSQVSILASVTSTAEVELARQQGYAPAIVVPEHTTTKAYSLPGSDIKWIPCPAQTKPGGKEIGCTDCRLCFNADRLYRDQMGISFAAHGVKQNNLKRRLIVLK